MTKFGIKRKYATTKRILKNDGPVVLAMKALEKVDKKRVNEASKKKINFLVKTEDVLNADWSINKFSTIKPVDKNIYTFNWIMSPPGKGGGGHQNLFRFIKFLESAGHKCRIYLYSNIDQRSAKEIKSTVKQYYPRVDASIEWLEGEMKSADGIFATGWETAYPVFNSSLKAQRFYFIQDFEPLFYPVGSEYVLAENTYKFGFHGITAGGWLSNKLNREYGMNTDHYDFGAGSDFYKFTNDKKRKEVFFYARPVTTRRGFELGIMALDIFHKKHPEYVINLAGWDVSDYDIPFPYKNLSELSLKELPALYNKCAAGLVLSLTNMSLLPLELLSCGTIPVVNDAENNRLVSDNQFIAYVPNSPASLANKLSEIVSMKDLPAYAKQAANSVQSNSWEDSGKKFVSIVEEKLRNG